MGDLCSPGDPQGTVLSDPDADLLLDPSPYPPSLNSQRTPPAPSAPSSEAGSGPAMGTGVDKLPPPLAPAVTFPLRAYMPHSKNGNRALMDSLCATLSGATTPLKVTGSL